jgi:hypothetical protein
MLRHVQDELQKWWNDLIAVCSKALSSIITKEIKIAGFVPKCEVAVLRRMLQS